MMDEVTVPQITPQSLAFLDHIPGTASVVRDSRYRATWCNDAFARSSELSKDEIIGVSLESLVPNKAARERESVYDHVIMQQQPAYTHQLWLDRHLYCSILPVNEVLFGYKGVLVMIQQAPPQEWILHQGPIHCFESSSLKELATLSRCELRVLFHLTQNQKNRDIAKAMHRAIKTVENHISSIFRKLRFCSRGEIIAFAVARGIDQFSTNEWESIVNHAELSSR
jgi:DNA-binding CsgD family transcriptional regulator